MNNALYLRRCLGYSSESPVITASNIANCVSNPIVRIIKKKRNAHNGDIGICAMPSGYTTNTRPGPMNKTILWWMFERLWINEESMLNTSNSFPWQLTFKKREFHVGGLASQMGFWSCAIEKENFVVSQGKQLRTKSKESIETGVRKQRQDYVPVAVSVLVAQSTK